MKSTVDSIDPSNAALKYLKKRIADIDYRGNIGSQHNRWDMNELIVILKGLDKFTSGRMMRIRTTDISKRPKNNADELEYAKFCNHVRTVENKGTQDSIRKNLFLDFHRAGWINRFDKNGVIVGPYDRRVIGFVSLSAEGKKIIHSEKLDNQFYLFSKGVDIFLGGIISKILSLLSDTENPLGYIDLMELTFFISGIGAVSPNINISITECRDLIIEWRKMSKMQRIGIDAHLKKELVPDMKVRSKLEQRDYHNWLNASQQGFHLLDQTVYFESRPDIHASFTKLYWMQKTVSVLNESEKEKAAQGRLLRSLAEKHEYFRQHAVFKTKGFELHHVVALSWAESEYHFKLLDSWNNMVYIDGFNHAKITQNRNLNVIMEINKSDIILKDFSHNCINFLFKKNILWNPKHATTMIKYNRKLLDFVSVI